MKSTAQPKYNNGSPDNFGFQAVTEIQNALNRLGFSDFEDKPLKTDGILGARTASALEKFKDAFSLPKAKTNAIISPKPFAPEPFNQTTGKDFRLPGITPKPNFQTLDLNVPKVQKQSADTPGSRGESFEIQSFATGAKQEKPYRVQLSAKKSGAQADREKTKNIESQLNKILDKQYPLTQDASWQDPLLGPRGMLRQSAADVANGRWVFALDKIQEKKDVINQVASKYKIPPEMIGAIILKEQYTQSIPDWLANPLTKAGETYPDIQNTLKEIGEHLPGKFGAFSTKVGRAFDKHTTGLGAINPSTARGAWENYYGKKYAESVLPVSDMNLQQKLSNDPDFNIETIALTLADAARELENNRLLNFNGRKIADLSADELQKVLARYNAGDITKAKKYADYTSQYLPYIKMLL